LSSSDSNSSRSINPPELITLEPRKLSKKELRKAKWDAPISEEQRKKCLQQSNNDKKRSKRAKQKTRR
jgi:hypothetical protein